MQSIQMNATRQAPHICRSEIESPEDPVFAGAPFSVRVIANCPEDCDLSGARLVAATAAGEIAAHAMFEDAEGGASAQLILQAPKIAGLAVWSLRIEPAEGGAVHELESQSVEIAISAHVVKMLAWDEPSTIPAGERLRFMLGARCTAGCSLAGQSVRVADAAGTLAQELALGAEVWPGTSGVHYAAADLAAGSAIGEAMWIASTGPWELPLPHDAARADIQCRVIAPPECPISVEVFDGPKQTPIPGARVVLHPHRAVTDEKGVANFAAAKGAYDLLVSARGFPAVSTPVTVDGPLSTRVEMIREAPWKPLEEV